MSNKITYFFTRDGNKLNELKYFENLLPSFNDYKTYVEPYAGSFGTLRGIYDLIKANDIKVHLNDIDVYLNAEIQWIKTVPLDDVKTMLDLIKAYLYRDLYVSGESEGKKIYRGIMEELKTYGIPDSIIRSIRDTSVFMGRVKGIKNYEDILPLRDLLLNCNFTCLDFTEIYEMYKNDSNAFLFLDPPYLDTNIKHYGTGTRRTDLGGELRDNSIHYIKMLEMLESAECYIMAVINKTCLTNYLFGKFSKGEYKKTYSRTKSSTTHMILTNY